MIAPEITGRTRRRQRRQRASPAPTSKPSATPARSNLGPLTTTFTPPPHCTNAVLACPSCSDAWRAISCAADATPHDDTPCWPSITSNSRPSGAPFSGLGFYSPGLLCPTGYTSACKAISRGPGDDAPGAVPTPGPVNGAFQFPLMAGETAVGCCPTGYTCATYPGLGFQTCHQVATSTQIPASTCGTESQASITPLSIPFTAAAATITSVNVWAPLIQINWQSSDISTTTSSSSSTLAPSSTLSSTAAAIPATTTPALPVAASDDGGLSSAAIAAIAFCSAIVFIIALLTAIYFLWIRRRYVKNTSGATPANSGAPGAGAASSARKITSPQVSTSSSKVRSMAAFSTPLGGKEGQDRGISDTDRAKSPTSPAPTSRLSAQALVFDDNEQEYKPWTPGSKSHLHPPISVSDANKTKSNIEVTEEYIPLDTFPTPPTPPPPAPFSRVAGENERDVESPIDGTSPFRLKRGNSLLKRNASMKSVKSGRGRLVQRSVSPPTFNINDLDSRSSGGTRTTRAGTAGLGRSVSVEKGDIGLTTIGLRDSSRSRSRSVSRGRGNSWGTRDGDADTINGEWAGNWAGARRVSGKGIAL